MVNYEYLIHINQQPVLSHLVLVNGFSEWTRFTPGVNAGILSLYQDTGFPVNHSTNRTGGYRNTPYEGSDETHTPGFR
jgi:hypothetical protein